MMERQAYDHAGIKTDRKAAQETASHFFIFFFFAHSFVSFCFCLCVFFLYFPLLFLTISGLYAASYPSQFYH